jgi:hypothetical protein
VRPLILALPLLLAGCLAASVTETSGTSSPAAPTPTVEAKPMDLDLVRPMVGNGSSGSWSWTVAPGFQDFRVELHLEGQGGAGLVQAQGVSYRLEGKGPTQRSAQAGGMSGLYSGSAQCLACRGSGFEGGWVLEYEVERAVGQVRIRILTTY